MLFRWLGILSSHVQTTSNDILLRTTTCNSPDENASGDGNDGAETIMLMLMEVGGD